MLLAAGYEVETAVDGATALEMIHKVKPDLILLDIEMPHLDGIQTAKMIRSNPGHRHISIIFLTANDSMKMKKMGFEIGADDYISKPFEPEELVARVDRKMVVQIDQRQATHGARVETLSQLMITLAHTIFNALGALNGREEVTDFTDPEQVVLFQKVFRKQTDRIRAVVECIKDVADSGKIETTEYLSQSFMLDIAKNLELKLEQQDGKKN
ncbi:response regulator [bacterium]|nr:response regulator [bacterium]